MNTTDKIMALADKYAFYVPGSTLGDAAREAMRAEIEALVRDAERHRFMRNADLDEMAAKYWPDGEVPSGDEYDAVIDAAMLNAAPTPPAQQDAQWDPSGLYARGWINGTQVQALIDWCNSGSTKRADIAFTGGPSRQIAYAIEHLVKRASNLETSEGVFVPRELLAKVTNALGLPYETEHTRLRTKLLDILSYAAPAQRVMLTDEEILDMADGCTAQYHDLLEYARAVIEAYEKKNGAKS